jgi:hypothetical protein
MRLNSGIILFLVFLTGTILFTIAGMQILDPDFGWHLQMGRRISSSGLPATDPFSYTMPSYPFIDHEWLTNLFIFRIYDAYGYSAVALVFGLLFGLLILIILTPSNLVFAGLPLLMGLGVLWSRAGVRPQIIDWLFLGLLLKINWTRNNWVKARWFVPGLFLVWANLHGGFALGPAILIFVIVIRTFETKRFSVSDFLIWIISVLATFVNPYGPRLWHEVWMQITDHNLRLYIAEWQPFWNRPELGLWLLVAMTAALISKSYQRLEKWKILLFIVFFAAGLSSLRHMPLLVLVSIIFTSDLSQKIYAQIKPDPLALMRAKQFYRLLYAISCLVLLAEVGVGLWRNSKGYGILYPQKAVTYLTAHPVSGQLFSDYGWGGYLIWNYPQKKVFIDGRMPSFRWEAPLGESDWAFNDYREISDKANFSWYFAKYNISTVLWPVNRITTQGNAPFLNLIRFFPWINKPSDSVDFLKKLEESGWQRTYEDEIAVVYQAPGEVK